MAVGLFGFAGVGVESSGGSQIAGVQAWSAAIIDYLPFTSEQLAVTRNDLPDPSIWGDFDERRMYLGLQTVQGALSTWLHPILTGYLLHMAFDTESSQAGWGQPSHANVRAHRFVTLQNQFMVGSGSDLPTLTMKMHRGPVGAATGVPGSSFVYYNVTANWMELSVDAGGTVQCNFDLIGRDYGGMPSSAPIYIPQDAFVWNQASVQLSVAGASPAFTSVFQSLKVRLENNLQAISKLDGRLRPDLIKRHDFRRVTVTGNTVFQDTTQWDAFQAGSEFMLVAAFTGKVVTTSGHTEQLIISVPRFRYSTYPVNIGGPGPIQIAFTGRGMTDQTSLYSLDVTMVNTRVSPYTVNTTA